MSNDDILASERGPSGGHPGHQDSLANLLDRHDLNPVRKIEPVRDLTHGESHSPDSYDLTNPNLHHGSQANGESGIPIQELSGSDPPHPVEATATSAPTSFHLAVGDSGPTATAIADQS